MRHRIKSGLCTAIAFALVTIAPTSNADQRKLNAQLRSIETALTDSLDRIRSLESLASGLELEVEALEEGMVVHARAERERNARLAEVDQRLAALDQERRLLDAEEVRNRSQLSAALGALAILERQQFGADDGEPTSTIAIARSSLIFGATTNALLRKANQRRAERNRIAYEIGQATKNKDILAHVASALTSDHARINALLVRKSAARQNALAEHERASAETKMLAGEANDLRSLLEKLARSGPLPPPPPRKPAPPINLASTSQSAGQFIRNSFAAARGSLPMPVVGSLSSTFGDTTAGGERSKGITIETTPGARVITPYDGQVVFVGPFRAYGQLLIIQHGEGYHMVLAGFSRIDSVLGQWLLAGEPVGVMGHPADGKPTLYIELRRSGVPINPVPWLTSIERKVSG